MTALSGSTGTSTSQILIGQITPLPAISSKKDIYCWNKANINDFKTKVEHNELISITLSLLTTK